ncbi:DinB/UmuC family translesion DNA polymerase [Streptomyces sp. 3213.3]|uniref:DinB/UmuC family translesion DNA polymerase n=1 Tax=Streptomyces sp. 3213.3 TaxID=1855348 RepID=UPI000A496B07|nr:hypothetical protein [Streptomyces sp. 3213.3]
MPAPAAPSTSAPTDATPKSSTPPTPTGISAEHRFPRDELDPAAHRRALLALADDLGSGLRTSSQIAHEVTCTLRYADQSSTRRSRTLPEDTFHTLVLARAAYGVYESLGLQRARVRSIALRADALQPASNATRQLTLDSADDKPFRLEAAADRARGRFGQRVLCPGITRDRSPPFSCSVKAQTRHGIRSGRYVCR